MKKRIVVILMFAVAFTLASSFAHAEVKLKIAVVNPSSTEAQISPIRYDLPKGIGPDQIVDIAGLEMKYDFDKGNYYLTGSVDLAVSEKKVLEITLRDVWSIPQDELLRLKEHTALLMKKLKDTKHYKPGTAIAANIDTQLDAMIKKEKDAALSIKDRINQYYEDLVSLNGIKENVGMLENLVLDVGGIVEERVQVPTTLAVPVASSQLTGDSHSANSIELKVKVTNPSKTEKMSAPVKFLLPVEVSPKYILDRGGLDMSYDFDKRTFCLFQDSVELVPAEVREFVVKIQDMWRIANVEIDALRSHTHNILVLLEGGEHYARAKQVSEKINVNLDLILNSQDAKVTAVEHIAYYRENTLLLQAAKREIADLERLVSQRGTSPGVTVKWPDEKGGGKEPARKRGYEGLDAIARSIFKGKALTIATTWKIICGIIAFLGFLSFIILSHFTRRRRVMEFDPLTGVYRRDSLMERSQEIIDRCRKTNVQAAFFLLDLDKFKQANDKFGHAFGDTVLKEFVGVLRGSLRTDDVVGRYGGDEFAIVLPNIKRSNAEAIAEKIRKTVSEHTTLMQATGQEFRLSTSVGVALYPDAGQNLSKMLAAADAAMYRSKASGGNAVNFT